MIFRDAAYQQCIHPDCGQQFGIEQVLTGCPSCGSLLDVKYDWNTAGTPTEWSYYQDKWARRSDPLNFSGIWRFHELLPFANPEHVVTVGEGQTLLQRADFVSKYVGVDSGNLFLQYEGMNPSGSFKDNGMSAAFTHAHSVGAERAACASTGNTSASAGMFAANEGIDCDVYIPAGQIAPGKLSQAYQFGAQIIQVEGNFDDALKQSLDDAKNHNGYTVNSVNPFRIEGQKTIPIRALEYLNWEVPDWIIYPGGALGNTSSCGKALMELYDWGWIKKIPRIAVINSEGASTLSDLYNGKFEGEELRWNKGNTNTELISRYYDHLDKEGIRPKTKATAIQIGRPANILKGLRALEFTNGVATTVTDSEMLDGMSVVGLNGFDCEMASGASVAGIKKLMNDGIIKKDDTVVGILTGRQKDAMIPVDYHSNSENTFANPPKN